MPVPDLLAIAAKKVLQDEQVLQEYKKATKDHTVWKGLETSLEQTVTQDIDVHHPVDALGKILSLKLEEMPRFSELTAQVVDGFHAQYVTNLNFYRKYQEAIGSTFVDNPELIKILKSNEFMMTQWMKANTSLETCFPEIWPAHLNKVARFIREKSKAYPSIKHDFDKVESILRDLTDCPEETMKEIFKKKLIPLTQKINIPGTDFLGKPTTLHDALKLHLFGHKINLREIVGGLEDLNDLKDYLK